MFYSNQNKHFFFLFLSTSMNKMSNAVAQQEYRDAISKPNELFSSRLDTPVRRHE